MTYKKSTDPPTGHDFLILEEEASEWNLVVLPPAFP